MFSTHSCFAYAAVSCHSTIVLDNNNNNNGCWVLIAISTTRTIVKALNKKKMSHTFLPWSFPSHIVKFRRFFQGALVLRHFLMAFYSGVFARIPLRIVFSYPFQFHFLYWNCPITTTNRFAMGTTKLLSEKIMLHFYCNFIQIVACYMQSANLHMNF